MGGALNLVRWLVETHGCPLSVKRDPKTGNMLSLQTSASRTLIDLAMTGKPKIDILSYLVRNGLSISDTKDQTLAPKTLQSLMTAGFVSQRGEEEKDEREQREPIMEASDVSVASIEDPVSFVILWPLNFVHKECNILTLRFILSVSYVMNIRWIVF